MFENALVLIYSHTINLFLYTTVMREQIQKYYADKKIFRRIVVIVILVLILIFQLSGNKR